MTKILHNKNRLWLISLAGFFCFAVTGFLSCQQKMDLEAGHLTGVFHGNDCSSTAAPNVVVRETEDNASIVITITPTGLGGCPTSKDVVGTLKGIDSVVYQKQTYSDKCGNQVTASGWGRVTGHSMQYYIKFVADVTGKKDSIVKCFAGTK